MNKIKNDMEQISNDISHLFTLLDIYKSFISNFYTDKYFSSIGRYETNIVIYLRNSILTHFYVIIRRLLSTNNKDISLCNYYAHTHQILVEQNTKYVDAILKACIPNHYDKWINFKKYLNKHIFHRDQGKKKAYNGMEIDNLRQIASDLENTYNSIASRLQMNQGKMAPDNAQTISDSLFKKWKSH